jgi:hypothetical protein
MKTMAQTIVTIATSMFFALASAACSSGSSSAVHADAGNAFGGNGGGVSNGNGGTPPGKGDVCASSGDDGTCLACLKQSCCEAYAACANYSECVAFFSCADADSCTDQTCVTSCEQQHPSAEATASAVVSCEQGSCASKCGVSSSGSNGGDQCLPDSTVPADMPDCQSTPNTPRERDCPFGSPSPSCIPAPNGATNVFCCPAS